MKRYKKNRQLTVSGCYDAKTGEKRPFIRITGEWLRELGFNEGDKINVRCDAGELVITKTDEIIQR